MKTTTTKSIPYFELEFAAFFFSPGTIKFISNPNARLYNDELVIIPVADLEPGSPSHEAIRDNIYAEVNIPYRLDEAGYTYTFHLFNKLNHIPAFPEVILLKEIIARVHADYHQRAEPRGAVEIEE